MNKVLKITVILYLLFTIVFHLCSCIEPISTGTIEFYDEVPRTTVISQRVGELKEAGLLDSLTSQNARSVNNLNLPNEETAKLNFFINNTDDALKEISESENGHIQLKLIEAIFLGGTVGEIADAMAEISEEMSNNYIEAISNIMNENLSENSINARAVFSSSYTNVRDIRLAFFDEAKNNQNSTRAAYGKDLSNSTVTWYVGFCAATIAGVYAAGAVLPWVSIPGIVAAAAGAASITAQLIIWYSCTDLKNFINSIAGKDLNEANKILNSSHGLNIIIIAGTTIATAVAISFSLVGRTAILAIKDAWNSLVTYITTATNINWTLWSIPFIRI